MGDSMPVSNSAGGRTQPASLEERGFADPYWSADGATLYFGDVREQLRQLPARSVHMCVTSPPYWGLRDYKTGTWEGGSSDCDHDQRRREKDQDSKSATNAGSSRDSLKGSKHCRKCGASRIGDTQIGMEDVLDCCGWATGNRCGRCYVCHLTDVFREVHRVLRDDGTLWLNLGDTFDKGQQLAPTLVALSMRADGWKLAQDIIWYSPNKMPESATDRCSKSHEHIFILAKSENYYFDNVGIMEPGKGTGGGNTFSKEGGPQHRSYDRPDYKMVNKRDVWVVPIQGYPGAHFATYSPKLITPCILAGTSDHGCCAACGSSYKRVVVRVGAVKLEGEIKTHKRDRSLRDSRNGVDSTLDTGIAQRETVGWQKACGCHTDEVLPCIVLDPFIGSGTTIATTIDLGRVGVGIDLSEKYLTENAIPRIESALLGEHGTMKRAKTKVMPKFEPPPVQRMD